MFIWYWLRVRWQVWADRRWRKRMVGLSFQDRLKDPYAFETIRFLQMWMDTVPENRTVLVSKMLHGKCYEGIRRSKTMEFAFWLAFSIDHYDFPTEVKDEAGNVIRIAYLPDWAPRPFRLLKGEEVALFMPPAPPPIPEDVELPENSPPTELADPDWPSVIAGSTTLLCALQVVPPEIQPYPFEPPL